jgi:hypothetical protein
MAIVAFQFLAAVVASVVITDRWCDASEPFAAAGRPAGRSSSAWWAVRGMSSSVSI